MIKDIINNHINFLTNEILDYYLCKNEFSFLKSFFRFTTDNFTTDDFSSPVEIELEDSVLKFYDSSIQERKYLDLKFYNSWKSKNLSSLIGLKKDTFVDIEKMFKDYQAENVDKYKTFYKKREDEVTKEKIRILNEKLNEEKIKYKKLNEKLDEHVKEMGILGCEKLLFEANSYKLTESKLNFLTYFHKEKLKLLNDYKEEIIELEKKFNSEKLIIEDSINKEINNIEKRFYKNLNQNVRPKLIKELIEKVVDHINEDFNKKVGNLLIKEKIELEEYIDSLNKKIINLDETLIEQTSELLNIKKNFIEKISQLKNMFKQYKNDFFAMYKTEVLNFDKKFKSNSNLSSKILNKK